MKLKSIQLPFMFSKANLSSPETCSSEASMNFSTTLQKNLREAFAVSSSGSSGSLTVSTSASMNGIPECTSFISLTRFAACTMTLVLSSGRRIVFSTRASTPMEYRLSKDGASSASSYCTPSTIHCSGPRSSAHSTSFPLLSRPIANGMITPGNTTMFRSGRMGKMPRKSICSFCAGLLP